MRLRPVLTWLLVAGAVFHLVQAPERSGEYVQRVGETLGSAAASLAAFLGALL